TLTLQGPLQIPHVFRMGQFVITYSRTQNRNASVQTAQMPTAAERAGNFSDSLRVPVDPLTGTAFPGGAISQNRISSQAASLVALYPLPNFSGESRYNYQVPVVGVTHADNFQGAITNIRIGRADQFSGTVGLQSTRSDNPDLFGFTDEGINS